MTTKAKPTATSVFPTPRPAAPPAAPAFDATTATILPHNRLFAHTDGRTVGHHQPAAGKDQVHLFGVNRRYIATVPASTLPPAPTSDSDIKRSALGVER